MPEIFKKNKPALLLAAGAASAALFILILLIAEWTTPAQIPSEYYADREFYAFNYSNIGGRAVLFLFLYAAAATAFLFRAELAGTFQKLRRNGKRIMAGVIVFAAAAFPGGMAAALVLCLAGEPVRESGVMTGAAFAGILAVQISLLIPKSKLERLSLLISKRDSGKTASASGKQNSGRLSLLISKRDSGKTVLSAGKQTGGKPGGTAGKQNAENANTAKGKQAGEEADSVTAKRKKRKPDTAAARAGSGKSRRSPAQKAARKVLGTERDVTGSCIFFAVTAAFLYLLFFEYLEIRDTAPELWGARQYMIPFGFLIAETLVLALLYYRYVFCVEDSRIDYRKIFLFLFVLTAVGYLLVFLPFVSPDEHTHYLSAYRLSDVFLGKITSGGDARLIMRNEDLAFYKGRKFKLSSDYYTKLLENWHLFAREKGYTVVEASMGTNSLAGYFPAALGIAIARVLNLGGNATFLAARFMNILFLALVLSAVMKKRPGKSAALFSIAMLPMMLHLSASCSYDIPTFCFTALFLSQIVSIREQKGCVSKNGYLKCVLYAMLLAPSKLVYTPLLFLSLAVPSRKFSRNRAVGTLMKTAIPAAGILAIPLSSLAVKSMFVHSALGKLAADNISGHVPGWSSEQAFTLSQLIRDPFNFAGMCVRTLLRQADFYFFTMCGQRLGWVDIHLPYVLSVAGFMAVCISLFMREKGEKDFPAGGKALAVFLAGGVIFAALLGMTLSWTVTSDNVVQGIQGRYFLPLTLLPVFLGTGRSIRVDGRVRKIIVLLVPMMNIWILNYVYAGHFFR